MILDAIEDILDQEPQIMVVPIDSPILAGVELSAASRRPGRGNRERNRG